MTEPPWPAPTAAGPVAATVRLPGSKSLTNRYLVLAALAASPSRLRAPLRSRDTRLMAAALRALGTDIGDAVADWGSPDGAADWAVVPSTLTGDAEIDCGLAGTVMRFLPAVAALADGPVRFDGDAHARTRPMGPVLGALRTLGVTVDDGGRGLMPFTVLGSGSMRGGAVVLDASGSSQFVSALLLAAARYDQGLTVVHSGPPVPSQPHLAMTVQTLRDCGVSVDDSVADTWRVEPGVISGLDVRVEPDLSNAAPFLAAAAVTAGRVTIPDWPERTTQAGDAMRDLLDRMGVEVRQDATGLTVTGSGELYGVDVDLHEAGELTPTVAALCALADSPSHLRGVAHIRGHETDRLTALATEINSLGGDVTETDDGLVIRPAPLHGGVFSTYADHRIATAGAILGLSVPGVLVEDVGTTAKTLPDFTGLWQAMLDGDPPPAGGARLDG